MPGVIDEFSFKQAVAKGLVIVNVSDLSTAIAFLQLSKMDCILLHSPGVCAAFSTVTVQLSVPFYEW